MASVKRMRRAVAGSKIRFDLPTLERLFRLVGIEGLVEGVHYLAAEEPPAHDLTFFEIPSNDAIFHLVSAPEVPVGKHKGESKSTDNTETWILGLISALPGGLTKGAIDWMERLSSDYGAILNLGIAINEERGRVGWNPRSCAYVLRDPTGAEHPNALDIQRIHVARTLHLKYCVELVQRTIGDPLDFRDAMGVGLDQEFANLPAALSHATAERKPDVAAQLLMAIAKGHLLGGGYQVARERIKATQAAFPASATIHSSTLYLLDGWLALLGSTREEAEVCTLLAELRHEDDLEIRMRCHMLSGAVTSAAGGRKNLLAARSIWESATKIATEIGSTSAQVRLAMNMALVERDLHRFANARRVLERMFSLLTSPRCEEGLAGHTILGEMALHVGDYQRASQEFHTAREMFSDVPLPMRQLCLLRSQIQLGVDSQTAISVRGDDLLLISLADEIQGIGFQTEARLLSALYRAWDHPAEPLAVRHYREARETLTLTSSFLCWQLGLEAVAVMAKSLAHRASAIGAADQLLVRHRLTGRNLKRRHEMIRNRISHTMGYGFDVFYQRGRKMKPSELLRFIDEALPSEEV